jgi:cysteine desulfuration protein SufE
MSEAVKPIPSRLQEIIEDFNWCEGQEKLELLLEFSEKLSPLPDRLRDQLGEMNQVHECMTPVFVFAETRDNKMTFYFDVPPESPTVRGYAALLAEGVQDASPEDVISIPNDFYLQMGLHQVLSHQRMNGISAILAHMKRLAVRELTKARDP